MGNTGNTVRFDCYRPVRVRPVLGGNNLLAGRSRQQTTRLLTSTRTNPRGSRHLAAANTRYRMARSRCHRSPTLAARTIRGARSLHIAVTSQARTQAPTGPTREPAPYTLRCRCAHHGCNRRVADFACCGDLQAGPRRPHTPPAAPQPASTPPSCAPSAATARCAASTGTCTHRPTRSPRSSTGIPRAGHLVTQRSPARERGAGVSAAGTLDCCLRGRFHGRPMDAPGRSRG